MPISQINTESYVPGKHLIDGEDFRAVFDAANRTPGASFPAALPSLVVNGITAFAGGGQASATLLTGVINRVTTVATAADSVRLPAALAGMRVTVINADAADAMNVFPATGEFINALAVNTAISVVANRAIDFICAVDGRWQSMLTA